MESDFLFYHVIDPVIDGAMAHKSVFFSVYDRASIFDFSVQWLLEASFLPLPPTSLSFDGRILLGFFRSMVFGG